MVKTTQEKTKEKEDVELSLYAIDFPLETLANRAQNQTLVLNPRFQRKFKWDDERASSLIESCLMRIPIPPCYFTVKSEDGTMEVIDGVQRITAIKRFFNNEFSLKGLRFYQRLNGKKFEDIGTIYRQDLLNYTIRCIILRKNNDQEIVREIFARINSGGVLLQPQEIRNALYPGTLSELINKLTEWLKRKDKSLLPTLWKVPPFKGNVNKQGKRIRTKNGVEKEFNYSGEADELILRYFALKELTGYQTLKEHLDSFYEKNKDLSTEISVSWESEYKETFKQCEALFEGDLLFRNPSNFKRKFSVIFYDLQMWGVRGLIENNALKENNKSEIVHRFKGLCGSTDFGDALKGGTAQRKNILKQRQLWNEAILGTDDNK